MTFRSVKELQQQRPTVEASSRAQDASGELAMKMSKLRALSDADKDLITTLQQRIDEQKSELESRTAMVEAVQRNFENLSNMAVREREELARLRAEEEEREAEMRALQVTIKSLQAKYQDVQKNRSNIERPCSRKRSWLRKRLSRRQEKFWRLPPKMGKRKQRRRTLYSRRSHTWKP